jgi:hypothetical protein
VEELARDAACSFCGKGPADVARLIAGPNVWICDECVRVCYQILEQVDPPAGQAPAPDQAPPDQSPPDDVMAAIVAAQQAALSGERDRARESFAGLWAQVGDDGDPLHRVTLAHFMADVQDDPAQELEWDRRALAAADVLTDDRAAAFHPQLTVRGMRASLHASVAADYERLGRLEVAREQFALAEAAETDLPDGGYGDLVRAVIRELRERLQRHTEDGRGRGPWPGN